MRLSSAADQPRGLLGGQPPRGGLCLGPRQDHVTAVCRVHLPDEAGAGGAAGLSDRPAGGVEAAQGVVSRRRAKQWATSGLADKDGRAPVVAVERAEDEL